MEAQDSIHVGYLVQSVFEKSGLSVSELARRIHVERTTIYSIFERPSMDVIQLVRLSKALDYNFLSEIEQHFRLTPTKMTLTLYIDKADSNTLKQFSDFLEAIQRK